MRKRDQIYEITRKERLRTRRVIGGKPTVLRSDDPDPVEYPDDAHRPRTRGDCADVPRPCPYVSCRWHLYLDVLATGSIKLNFPALEPGDLPPDRSCALDVADRGGETLDECAAAINMVRERARQIEERALGKLELRVEDDGDIPVRRDADTVGGRLQVYDHSRMRELHASGLSARRIAYLCRCAVSTVYAVIGR